MPQTIDTFGSQAKDREIDELWRQIKALQKAQQQVNTQPPPAQVTPLTGIVVQDSSGSPQFQVNGIEFNSADGAVVSLNGHNALITITVVKTFAKTGGTLRTGDISLTEGAGITITDNGDGTFTLAASAVGYLWDFFRITATSPALASSATNLYQRVFDDGTTGRTLTLPDPTTHLLPIWVRALSAPAGGHTLARFGSESIDGSAADVTMGTIATQVNEICLRSNGTDWYSLARKTL